MTNEIKNIDEFIFLINDVLDNAELFIKKEVFDSSIINNSDSEYLEYYCEKRKKLVRKFSDQSFLLRIEFADKIKINVEDFEQLLITPNYILDYISRLECYFQTNTENDLLSQIEKEKKELNEYFTLRIKDVKNSIKLSYYNLRINQLQNSKTQNDNYNTDYLDVFKLNGFELFQHMNEHLKITAQTVKYTIIFHFIDDLDLIVGTREKYLEFVKPYLKNNLKFSRMDFLHRTDDKYKKYLQHLTLSYKEFLKPQ